MQISSFSPLDWLRSASNLKRGALLGVLLLPVLGFFAFGQSTPPNIKSVSLTADPLYAPTTFDKPAITLALSVEYPTVGAQFYDPTVSGGTLDASYSNATEYLGYYDAYGCYQYNDAPTETPAAGLTTADYKRFDRVGPSSYSMCTSYPNAFSGNFLNWASSSAIDTMRMALTGGDRYIDQTNLTILQRAVLPNGQNGTPIDMWNSGDFPAKQLHYSGGSSGQNYFGAVPAAMATAAGQNDIWVANTLNRIYFGTTRGGSSSSSSSYNLGGSPPTIQKGPQVHVTTTATSYPSDLVSLGGENQVYTWSGTQEVWFGVKGQTSWTVLPAYGGIDCYWNGGGGPYGGITDPLSGVAKQCYVRAYNPSTSVAGSWTPTVSSASNLNSDGFFFARASVCNVNASGVLQDVRDWGLCTKYPSGNYKPTGSIQKYADSTRVGVFGYLIDQTQSYAAGATWESAATGGRYGAVLRAPLGYVGDKTFDESGVENTPSTGNPAAEWDLNTGVFKADPLNTYNSNLASGSVYSANNGTSGVINYLNKFGRTATQGMYKIYDPIGELHYEALRYLQGVTPSPAAISGISTASASQITAWTQNFPVYTAWTDPYANRSATADYSCLKSSIMEVGDVHTWDGQRYPAIQASQPTGWADVANNNIDINYWMHLVQNFEKTVATSYVDGAGVTRYTTGTTGNWHSANNQVPTITANSAYNNAQIMGTAYWAHTHDIRPKTWTNQPTLQRPGLRVKTFTFDVNEYGANSNLAVTAVSNPFFLASKYGGFQSDPSNTQKDPYNTWGNPFRQDDGTANDNVWAETDGTASRAGYAASYFQGSTNARSIFTAFDTLFARASTAATSIAGGAIQSKNLTQAGDTIFQGTFDTSDWSGDLVAIPVLVNASNVVSLGTSNTWTAATQLAALPSPATSRNVYIGNSGATSNPVASRFQWSSLSSTIQGYLNTPGGSQTADGLGQYRLNYLLGDKSKEGNPFRTRNKLMGDVINSGVIYEGDPSTNILSSTYSTFYNANVGRTQAVYVGANDGMFHAFNALTGAELFAYIPSWLASKLSLLTNTTYPQSHQSYADGTAAVGEAELSSGWKTVLVSGTGGGGRGVFALDVTNPSSFSASNVLWEFTNSDDADLGYVIGRPQILKMRTSDASATTPTYKWFAVVASGVNNYVPDTNNGNIFSTTGQPALFFLDLSKPSGTAWSLGSNYYKVSFPTNSTLNPTVADGMINFSPVFDNQLAVSQIFAGDLQGNLWKLNFATYGASNWSLANLSAFHTGTSSVIPIPLYIAQDSTGKVQPISNAPRVVAAQASNAQYLLFGTGKYIEVSDRSDTSTQSEYMVYDDGSGNTDGGSSSSAISSRSNLQAGSINATTGVVTVPAFTPGLATSTTAAGIKSGWYVDLPTSGERQVSNGTVFGTQIVFGTLIPAATGVGSSCAAAGGSGNIYNVNFLTGSGSSIGSQVGILGEPLVVTLSSATTQTATDSTGRRVKTITKVIFQQGSNGVTVGSAGSGSGGGSNGGTTTQTQIVGRLSWRRINNYQNLYNNPNQ